MIYRDFESLADIKKTRSILDAVAAFDNLLSKMQITLKPLDTYGYVGHYNLVLTMWARQILAVSGSVAPLSIDPLSIDQVRQFFSHLWGQQEKPFRVSNEKKEQFLAWISETAGLPEYDVSATLGQTFETLFRSLEEEYANVAPRALELKYVHGFFLLAPETG